MVTKDIKKRVPLISWVIGAVGLMWISISYLQWVRYYPDISQLIFGVGLGFGIIYVSYDYWWKRKTERKIQEKDKELEGKIEELGEACDRILDYSRTEIEKLNKVNDKNENK